MISIEIRRLLDSLDEIGFALGSAEHELKRARKQLVSIKKQAEKLNAEHEAESIRAKEELPT